jgi:hypothetical protein
MRLMGMVSVAVGMVPHGSASAGGERYRRRALGHALQRHPRAVKQEIVVTIGVESHR